MWEKWKINCLQFNCNIELNTFKPKTSLIKKANDRNKTSILNYNINIKTLNIYYTIHNTIAKLQCSHCRSNKIIILIINNNFIKVKIETLYMNDKSRASTMVLFISLNLWCNLHNYDNNEVYIVILRKINR